MKACFSWEESLFLSQHCIWYTHWWGNLQNPGDIDSTLSFLFKILIITDFKIRFKSPGLACNGIRELTPVLQVFHGSSASHLVFPCCPIWLGACLPATSSCWAVQAQTYLLEAFLVLPPSVPLFFYTCFDIGENVSDLGAETEPYSSLVTTVRTVPET